VSLEYKSDLRRDGNDYLSKNAEQEVSVKLGLDYQQDDIITSKIFFFLNILFINSLKLPSNSAFNTITMGFIVS
jgi:hypothetical protein